MTLLALAILLLALLPAVMVGLNAAALRTPALPDDVDSALVSILIPARDEADNIGPALAAALASCGVPIEVVVGDDGSTDGTAGIVRSLAAEDPRLRLLAVPPLAPGWAGKVHACARLAAAARGSHLLFLDADVRLEPEGAARLLAHARRTGTALVSGVPRQVMGGLGEVLTVPLINLLMLGYLPVGLMRRRPDPSLGAACGQMILVEHGAYRRTGGHGAVRAAIHDGVALVRAFRAAGLRTDLVRGATLASCRMYRSFPEAWAGFSKNARDGLATPRGLPIWTLLLAGGHVLPYVLAVAAALGAAPALPAVAAMALTLLARLGATLAGRERPLTVLLHPATVLVALALQWRALLAPTRAVWKGRSVAAT